MSSDSKLLHVAREAGQLFGNIAALGGNGRFLREARGIELRFAEQFPQALFQAAGKGGPRALGDGADFGGMACDRAKPPGHFLAEMVRLPLRACDPAYRALRPGSAQRQPRGARAARRAKRSGEPMTPGKRRMEARSGSA